MAVIAVPRRLYAQPQHPAQIDLGHSLGRSVVYYQHGTGREVFGSLLTLSTANAMAPRQRGLLWTLNQAALDRIESGVNVSPPLTACIDVFYGGTHGAYRSVISNGGWTNGWGIYIPSSASTFGFSFGFADYSVSTATLVSGAINRIAIVVSGNGGTARYYLNGVFDSSRAVGTMATPQARGVALGAAHDGSGWRAFIQSSTLIGNATVFNRALSDSEVLEEYANPWQIFRAPYRRIYLPASTGSTYDISGDVRDEAFTTGTIGRSTPVLGDDRDEATASGVIARSTPVLGDILDDGAVAGAIGRSTAVRGDDLAEGAVTGDVESSGPATVDVTAGVTAAAFTTGAIGRSTAIAGIDLDEALATGAITIAGQGQTVSAEGGVTAGAFCTGSLGVTPYFPWAIRVAPGMRSVRAVKLRGTPR